MNIKELFSTELYDNSKFYKYFSKNEIQNIPYDLCDLINYEQKNGNKFIFQNFVDFFCDLYVNVNIKEKDFLYIDSKLDEFRFCEKFSSYLYSDFLIKKEGAILVFAKMKKQSNCEYLESAFINEYYKKNPILTANCLKELFYLKSEKANEFEKLLFKEIDLINFISIILLNDDELTEKVLELYKNEKIIENIKKENLPDFAMNFEIFITNVQVVNKIKEFKRDEYLKSVNYFEKIYGSYKVEDFYCYYKNALQEIEKYT